MQEKILLFLKENKILSLASLVGIVIISVAIFKPDRPPDQVQSSSFQEQVAPFVSAEEAQDNTNGDSEFKEDDSVTVDIKGAVNRPGVYVLKDDERMIDAIEEAGGFRSDANQNVINLAKKLTDEELIYIPTLEETPDNMTSANLGSSSNDKIHLNTATVSDLETIPGIGTKRAQDIIDYRDDKGGFTKIEELKEVSGIGQKTFEKIEEHVDL